jgi:hypothetical protein
MTKPDDKQLAEQSKVSTKLLTGGMMSALFSLMSLSLLPIK